MPYSLGTLGNAIGENYAVPQKDIAGSIFQGMQAGQTMQAKREAARLKREADQAKEDAAFDKALSSVDIKDIDPAVLAKAQADITPYIAEATKLYQENPRKNHIKISQAIQAAQNKVYENKAISDRVKYFRSFKDEELSGAGIQFRNDLNEVNDIRAFNGRVDPVTGESVNNNLINYRRNKFIDINKARNDVLQNLTQDIIKTNELGKNQRQFTTAIPESALEQTAKEFFYGDKELRRTYFNQNRDYVIEKYHEGVPLDKRSAQNLEDNADVQNDLYNKFLQDTKEAAPKYNKHIMDAIPQPSNGQGSVITSPAKGNEVAIKVTHPSRSGVEREYKAKSLYNAQVEMTNGTFPTALIKDAKTGKKIDTKDPVVLLKSGNVQVYPFYKDLKNNKLSGRIVPDENIDKLDPSEFDYKPALLGITNDDDQVIVEFDANNDVMNTLRKGSKDRQAQTTYDVKKAYTIADEANKKKNTKGTKPTLENKKETPAERAARIASGG